MSKDCVCMYLAGSVKIREAVDFCPTVANPNPNVWRDLGNVSNFAINTETTELTVKDYRAIAGNACSYDEITDVTLDLTLRCMSHKNLLIGFLGEETLVTGGSIVDEQKYYVEDCSFIPTDNIIDTTQPVVVQDTAGGGGTVFVEGTDYVLVPGGIQFPENSTIPALSDIFISYTYLDQNVIDIFAQTSKTYELFLSGYNKADNSLEFTAHLFKVKFGPLASFSFLGDDFALMELNPSIQADACQLNAKGFGRYGKLTNFY